ARAFGAQTAKYVPSWPSCVTTCAPSLSYSLKCFPLLKRYTSNSVSRLKLVLILVSFSVLLFAIATVMVFLRTALRLRVPLSFPLYSFPLPAIAGHQVVNSSQRDDRPIRATIQFITQLVYRLFDKE